MFCGVTECSITSIASIQGSGAKSVGLDMSDVLNKIYQVAPHIWLKTRSIIVKGMRSKYGLGENEIILTKSVSDILDDTLETCINKSDNFSILPPLEYHFPNPSSITPKRVQKWEEEITKMTFSFARKVAFDKLNDEWRKKKKSIENGLSVSYHESVEKFHHHLDCDNPPDFAALVDIYRKLKNVLDFLENTPRLTRQDLDVYGLKSIGHTSKEIADLLGIELFAVDYSYKKVKNALHMRYPDGGGLKS